MLKYPLKKIYITQYFGESEDIYNQYGLKGHNGIDLRTKFDDSPDGNMPVYPAKDGTVKEIGNQGSGGYGIFVRLYHDKIEEETVYGHLKEYFVKVGDKVFTEKTQLGITDNTGKSTGSHLHFGYRPNGYQNDGYCGYVDPLKYIMKNILIKNNTNEDVNGALIAVKEWFRQRGEELNFLGTVADPWAVIDINLGDRDGGGCNNIKPYYINWSLSNKENRDQAVITHELLHCFYFDAGFGDFEYIKTDEYPRGLSMDNEYVWNYLLRLKNMLQIVGDKSTLRQYIQNADGTFSWIFGQPGRDSATLDYLHRNGIVNKNIIKWVDEIDQTKISDPIGILK